MTTRRNFMRAAATVPVLVAIPAAASICEPDPAIRAIKTYREVRAIYADAVHRWESDEEVNSTSRAECVAAVAALTTVPTTPAGFRDFCQFGAWLLSLDEGGDGGLANWWPGDNSDLPSVDVRDAERMYLATLAEAGRAILPA